jgi:ECF transporter S component (folate family)
MSSIKKEEEFFVRNTRIVVFMGLFVALEIVLTRFLSIQTPIVRIGFGFVPIALSAMMFGPLVGGVTAALADIIRMMLFPNGASYFPGFTLTAFLGGIIYGLILYKKPKSVIRIALSVIIIRLFANIGLDTVWLVLFFNKAAAAIMIPRVITSIIILPIQTIVIFVIWKYLGRFIETSSTDLRYS